MNKHSHHALQRPWTGGANTLVRHGLVALLACSAVSAAHAQSDISIYGRVSGGVNYVTNVATSAGGSGNALRYDSNNWGPSFLGFKGSEDLGGGLKAVFNLENMFLSGDAQLWGSGLWNRYAVVGLSSTTMGTILFGKAMTLLDGDLWAVDPMGMQMTSIGTLVNFRNSGSRDNAITYSSPEFGGLSFRLQAEPGEQAGNAQAKRGLAGTLSYHSNGLLLKAAYEEQRDVNGEFSSLYGSSRNYALGGKYTQHNWSYFGGYSLIKSGSATVADTANPVGATENKMLWLGVNYQAAPEIEVLGAMYRATLDKNGGSATLLALGGNYHLSKRTMLYTSVGVLANKGVANFSVQAFGPRPQAGAQQQGVYAGVMHWF